MNNHLSHLFGMSFILVIILAIYGLLLESHHRASQRSRLIEAIIKNLERKSSREQRDNNKARQISASVVPNPHDGCDSK